MQSSRFFGDDTFKQTPLGAAPRRIEVIILLHLQLNNVIAWSQWTSLSFVVSYATLKWQ